jgi:hypothetical protein
MANPWDFSSGTVWFTNCTDYPDFVGSECSQFDECSYTIDDLVLDMPDDGVFGGLSHLEGETVCILADGKVLDQQVVVGGQITLPASYTIVHIGLPYYSDLETLDIEIGLPDGTLQGSKVKVGNLILRFVDSRGGWFGPDEDNIYEAFTDLLVSRNASELIFSPSDYDWTTQDVNDPDPYLFTGDIRRPLGGGYKRGGRSFFRQVDPLPVIITAVIPEIAPGGPI